MKLTVLGVKHISGIATKTGQPFSMCRLLAMTPVENTSSEKFSSKGAGFELAELELDEASMAQFVGLKFPVQLDLTTDSRPFRGKFETVVVGFVPPVVKAA